MAKTLADAIKAGTKKKVPIGYADLQGYQAALDAMASLYEEVQQGEGGVIMMSNDVNKTADIELTGQVDAQGFIDDLNLKQMQMDIGFIGGVPIDDNGTVSIYAPAGSDSGSYSSGRCCKDINKKICPASGATAFESNNDAFKVGVLIDITTRGQQYIDKFYPEDSTNFQGAYRTYGTSLSKLCQEGMLWAEIAMPASDNAGETQGKVFVAQVIGDLGSSVNSNAIMITSPLALHSNFSSIFTTDAKGTFPYASNQYDSMEGIIEGFTESEVKAKIENSTAPSSVKQLGISSVTKCRVRLWASREKGAAGDGIPEEFFDRNYKETAVNSVTNVATGAVDGMPAVTGVFEGSANRISQKEIRTCNSKFGKPGDQTMLTSVVPPYPMKIGGKSVKGITVHKFAAKALEGALAEILQAYGLERIQKLELDIYDGSLCVRKTRGGGNYSIHSWALAIDFCAAKNGMKTKKPQALFSGPEYKTFIDIMEKYGWMSLGRHGDYDWMHFQWTTWG